MKVKDLKTICGLVNTGGLINEFVINPDGRITGIDGAKTVIADITYFNLDINQVVSLSDIVGIMSILSRFNDDEAITIKDNKLHIISGYKYAEIVMKVITDQTFKLPTLTDDDYEIIVKGIDHNILNELAKLDSSLITNEDYYLFADGNILMFRIGNVVESNMGDKIGEAEKAASNDVMKIIGNVGSCFKNIKTTSEIRLAMKRLMLIECATEEYVVKYYIAPRMEQI